MKNLIAASMVALFGVSAYAGEVSPVPDGLQFGPGSGIVTLCEDEKSLINLLDNGDSGSFTKLGIEGSYENCYFSPDNRIDVSEFDHVIEYKYTPDWNKSRPSLIFHLTDGDKTFWTWGFEEFLAGNNT